MQKINEQDTLFAVVVFIFYKRIKHKKVNEGIF